MLRNLTFEQREEERRYKERKKAEARAKLLREKVTTGSKLAKVEAPVLGKRHKLTDAEEFLVHEANEGRCHLCGAPVDIDEAEWDHVLDRQFGGSENLENFAPAHPACHQAKTSENAGHRGKADRRRKAFNGEKKPKGRKIPSAPFDKGYRPLTGRGF